MTSNYRFADRTNGQSLSLIRQMNALAAQVPGVINLGIGELPYEMPAAMIAKGHEMLDKKVSRYTFNAGIPELRELIAAEHKRETLKDVSKDNVIVTVGVQEALDLSFATFLNPGDNVLIPEISFSPYRTIPPMYGAGVREYKLHHTTNKMSIVNNFGIDFGDLESKIDQNTKLVVVNTPSNPTGYALTSHEKISLAQIAKRNPGVTILSDEVYSNIYSDKLKPSSLATYTDNVIVLDGLSKRSCATGLRLGWAIAQKEVIDKMIPLHQKRVTCAPTLSQHMALPVLEGKCAEEEEKIRSILNLNKRHFTLVLGSKLNFGRFDDPRGGFYLFPNISPYTFQGERSFDLAKRILSDAKVVVIPGIEFGNAGEHHIRISYAVSEDNAQEGVKRLREFFSK